MFKVTIDFGDDTLNEPKFFESYSDLSQFLERIPNMLGFVHNKKANINIMLVQP